jgi:hypothetical protein
MSRIDSLPADQRAVLQLLLRQGRRYGELSDLLEIDEAAVRRRAHEAIDALSPDVRADLEPARREEIADHLLGQQSDEQRAATRAFLEGSPPGRAWASPRADALREVAGDRVPEIPSDGAAVGATAGVPGAERAGAAAGAHAAAAEAFGERPGARSSRRAGAFLLAAIGALAAVAVVLVLVLRGGGDDTQDATPAAGTTQATQATQPKPQVEAQVNLTPPPSRKGSKAIGIVLIQRAQDRRRLVAAVQGLSKPKAGGYGIWLYTSAAKARWLGFFASQDDQGRLLARGDLNAPIEDYREVLVTRESRGNPSRPGPVFLRGRVQAPSGG